MKPFKQLQKPTSTSTQSLPASSQLIVSATASVAATANIEVHQQQNIHPVFHPHLTNTLHDQAELFPVNDNSNTQVQNKNMNAMTFSEPGPVVSTDDKPNIGFRLGKRKMLFEKRKRIRFVMLKI